MPQSNELRGLNLRDYLGMVWRRLWLVVLVVAVCAGTSFLFANTKTRMYEAAARLLYQPPTDVSDPTASRSSINLSLIHI